MLVTENVLGKVYVIHVSRTLSSMLSYMWLTNNSTPDITRM
jgi:hypothetical protein